MAGRARIVGLRPSPSPVIHIPQTGMIQRTSRSRDPVIAQALLLLLPVNERTNAEALSQKPGRAHLNMAGKFVPKPPMWYV